MVSAVAMVAGLIPRDLVLGRARRNQDLAQVELLLQVSDPFEKMVVYGSVSVFGFGIVTMLVQAQMATEMPLFVEFMKAIAHEDRKEPWDGVTIEQSSSSPSI